MKKISFILILSLLIFSCNKNKKFSKRLAGETWTAVEITIDSDKQENLPSLIFNECDIYKDNCYASWQLDESSSNFIWQFREKAEIFEISNQSELTTDLESSIRQCINFSGVYDVTVNSKTSLTLNSTSTVGYDGQEVIIKIQKQ